MSRWLGSLRARLLLANLVVAGAALGTVVIVVSLVGPGYFAHAMGMQSDNAMGGMMNSATGLAFDYALRSALIAAGAIALVASIAISLAVSGAIAGPAARLAAAAHGSPPATTRSVFPTRAPESSASSQPASTS